MVFRVPFLKACIRWCYPTLLGFSCLVVNSYSQPTASVNVNFSKPIPNVKNLVGFLHGIDDTSPADSTIAPLRPRCWRIGSLDNYTRLRHLGVSHFEYTISDGFEYGRKNGWPYQNWEKWEAYVKTTAEHLKTLGVMEGVEFKLDPWNEPNIAGFWAGTFEQYCETYKRAYLVLRQVLGPDVLIGGPNESRYLLDHIDQFMNYCLTNGLEVNYVSWHAQREPSWPIYNIYVDIQHMRQTYMENPKFASLKIKEIIINEYAAWSVQYRPAEIVAHLYYMEKGGVTAASKACWKASWLVAPDLDKTPGVRDNCLDQNLDGITQHGTNLPRSAWHAYRVYAEGEPSSRVNAETISNDVLNQTDKRVFAIASSKKNDITNAAQVLIGNYSIVTGPVYWGDMGKNQESPATANITLSLLSLASLPFMANATQVKITIEKVPNSEIDVLLQTPPKIEELVPVVAGSLTYNLPNFPLHDLWSLTISNPAVPTTIIPVAGVQEQKVLQRLSYGIDYAGNRSQGLRYHLAANDGWVEKKSQAFLVNAQGRIMARSNTKSMMAGWNSLFSIDELASIPNGIYTIRQALSTGEIRTAHITLVQ